MTGAAIDNISRRGFVSGLACAGGLVLAAASCRSPPRAPKSRRNTAPQRCRMER